MRELTAKQKKLLRRGYIESGNREMHEGRMHPNFTMDSMTDAQWDILIKINDTEVLYQNVERFLNDLRMEGI